MLTGGAAKRYAQATFELARDTNTIETWQRDLGAISDLLNDPAGREFFESPKIDAAQKQQVAERFLQARVQPVALNLARLLIRRGRFAQVDRVAAAFSELVREYQGTAVADVTTAVPLDPPAAEAVRRRLSALVGKQVEMRSQVDPSIIGGIVARVGDYLIDGSVTGQLTRLRARLTEGR